MTRAVAYVAAALLAATLGAAQDTSSASGTASGQNTTSNSTTNSSQSNPSTSTTSSSQTSSTSDQNTTIQGCLSGSALGDNSFKLTDQNGTVYALTGSSDQLKSHVGHEVSISGQKTSASSTSANTGSTSGQGDTTSTAGNTIQVSGVTMVSDHCKTSGSGPSAQDGNAKLIYASMQSAPATNDQGNSGSAADQAAGQTHKPAGDQNTGTKKNLPNTATLLPLVGLLGLGSLVAGFLVRR